MRAPANAQLALASVCVCVAWTITVAVEPRRRSHVQSSILDTKARMALDGALAAREAPTRPLKFLPTITRCCKLGEKSARKGLTCSASIHAVDRRKNIIYTTFLRSMKPSTTGNTRSIKHIAQKIQLCAASKYAPNFEKCCRYRAAFVKEMEECKQKSGRSRKMCKKAVRRRYP